MPTPPVRSLLLVRNGVDHDARVLRAARVAEQVLDGTALVVGVATATAPAGATIVEGVPVLRLPARPPGLTDLGLALRAGAKGAKPLARGNGDRAPEAYGAGHVSANGAGHASANGSRPHGATGAEDAPANGGDHAIASNRVKPESRAAVPPAPALALAGRARRILSGLSFSRQALSVARQTRPALVHANDWNTMWTGLAIKVRYGTRLVYDSHELWADRNGRWEWRPWLLAGEALFVRAADEVVTSSSGYADVFAARYRIRRPTVVRNIPERLATEASSRHPIRQKPAPPEAGPHAVPPNAGSQPAGPPAPLRVVYVGGLMPGRGLEQMIDALPLLPDVRLCAIGPGTPRYRTGLLTRAAAVGVADRLVLRAPVAPGEVQGALAGAAAGLCLIQPICRSYELCLPNKLFEYAAAGVPVLASDVPVIAAVVRGSRLGEVVAADGPRAIAASLRRLLVPGGWTLTANRVRAFADAHDWTGEACRLAEVYERAASGTAS
jgi:glycogen synthase